MEGGDGNENNIPLSPIFIQLSNNSPELFLLQPFYKSASKIA
jgi:hypothetical protein